MNRRNFLKAAAGTLAAAALPAATAGANRQEEVFDVIIVGAGLAGLTAARDLQRAGCKSFLVLEARDRTGGRTLNHDLGNGYVSEAGGQWIGPGQTAIANLARELDVGTFATWYEGESVLLAGDGRVAIDLHGTLGSDLDVAARLDVLARDVPSGAPWNANRADELDKLSLGDWLAQQNLQPADQLGWNLTSLLTGGAMPARMGLLHFLSMINSAGSRYERLDSIRDSAQETRFVGGSQILSRKIAEALGEKVRLSTPVRRIRGWDQAIVSIDTDAGAVLARCVIMAIMPALCERIGFEPALPAPRQHLQKQWPAWSPGRKTAHVYAEPFWRSKGLSGMVMQTDGPVIWAYDNSPPDGSIGVLNAFVMPSMLPSDPTLAGPLLADIYARALGEDARHYEQFHDLDWGREPWSISCVSAIPPGFWSRHGEALVAPVGKLLWSGTETADIWAGYMDGAVRSGHRSALQALQALREVPTT